MNIFLSIWKLLLPIFQIILWAISYDLYTNFVFHHYNSRPVGVAWGITLQYYFYAYILFVLLFNIIVNSTKKYHLIYFLLSMLLLTLFVIQAFDDYPYRTSYIIISSAFYLSMSLIKIKRSKEILLSNESNAQVSDTTEMP